MVHLYVVMGNSLSLSYSCFMKRWSYSGLSFIHSPNLLFLKMHGSSLKFWYLIIMVLYVCHYSLTLYLCLQVKSMAQHLSNLGKLNSQRRDRFSSKFMEDLDTLVGSVAMEICNKHVQVYNYWDDIICAVT